MDKGDVDRLVAAHKSAERQHERTRRVHLTAEAFYRREGRREQADRERRRAERQQRGAEIERERLHALLSGDERAYLRARNLRMPAPAEREAVVAARELAEPNGLESEHLVAQREQAEIEREMAQSEREMLTQLRGRGQSGIG